MQLTKLLTLSQFIDQCEGSSQPCYFAIVNYNNFLKQPLTKEMFVGDEAIFDGWTKSMCYTYQVNHLNGVEFISFANCDFPVCVFYCGELVMNTLFDLAEATKGTLTLKNVEI